MLVYDILNAGSNHRFMVRGKDKKPFIVSNCVQAIARDVFGEAKLRVIDAGYEVPTLSVHDEVVVEVDETQSVKEIEKLMSVTPTWLPGCPIAAEGIESPYYVK